MEDLHVKRIKLRIQFKGIIMPVVDPGFPRGGGTNSNSPTYDFAKFSQKLHEIERIWAPEGGACVPRTALRSATACGASALIQALRSERDTLVSFAYVRFQLLV